MTAIADDETSNDAWPRPLRRGRLIRIGRVLIVAFAGFVVCDHLGAFGYRGDDWATFDRQSVRVEKVLDGDTLSVRRPGASKATIVRLIGIDAPDDGMFGYDAATRYTSARALNRSVTLRLEPLEPRDEAGRLRAYVYLTDNECLNLSLIRDGEAYADRRQKHTLRAVFEQAENEARKKTRGQWKEITFDRMPAWRQDWLRSLRRDRTQNDDRGD